MPLRVSGGRAAPTMTVVPAAVRYLSFEFRFCHQCLVKPYKQELIWAFRGTVKVWGAGVLVSLPAAGGCLDAVHGSDEHVANNLSSL